jgi:hypothetical protein
MSKPTDDEIISLWRTVRPTTRQDRAMVYRGDTGDDYPTWELRRLVELAMEQARTDERSQT